ncbi:MAG: hypothetical protein ACE5LU_30105 [Anaerolineae bacterium]
MKAQTRQRAALPVRQPGPEPALSASPDLLPGGDPAHRPARRLELDLFRYNFNDNNFVDVEDIMTVAGYNEWRILPLVAR